MILEVLFGEESEGEDKMKNETVCIVGLGYVKLFCKQKPLLKICLRYFFASKNLY